MAEETNGPPGPEPGERIDRYRILRLLGSGGMGRVYLARDERLDRDVALKILAPRLAVDADARRRFLEEAKAVSGLDHPHIGVVHDVGETPNGATFISMAYYEGETLERRLARGPLPVAEAIGLAGQLASALAAVHRHGIIHRDIKPGNILLTRDGIAKLLDFGIAKIAGRDLTEEGATIGTVAYMSPEQARGDPVDARTDLWSLGVVLYESLAGSAPFRANRPEVTLSAILHGEPDPLRERRPDAPVDVVRVVERCLEKEPNRRHLTADELLADLDRMAEPQAAAASTVPSGKGLRRFRPGVAAGAPGPPTGESEDHGRAPRTPTRTPGTRALEWGLVLAAALAIGVFAWFMIGRSGAAGFVEPAATRIAVLPFTSPAGDTALARLGRELVVTLSATLDGVGDVRTIEPSTMLAQVDESGAERAMEEDAELARRLGAGSFLLGTLVRSGSSVRLDARLFEAEALGQLARASVTAPGDSIGALTDSAALALLRGVWREGDPPAPSLEAITTRSIPALRAYLRGERAYARARWREAVEAFDEAFAHDSTFWIAYWRSLYPRLYEGSQANREILERLVEHIDELPEPDRLYAASQLVGSISAHIDTLRKLTDRFPDYWPGWYALGNALVHQGPYLGATWEDARQPFERVLELNPGFEQAWGHLYWTVLGSRDTAWARQVLERIERLPSYALELPYQRMLYALLREDGELPADEADAFAATSIAASRQPGGPTPGMVALAFAPYGFPQARLALIDAVLARDPYPEMGYAMRAGRAATFAMRGAWDSALVATERWVRAPDEGRSALQAYGLAAVGVWLAAVEPDRARALRMSAAGSELARSGAGAAELVWVDGLLAAGEGDAAALAAARERARGSEAEFREYIDRSLAAFELAVRGDTAGAAEAMADLAAESAERALHQRYGTEHPYLASVNHLAAARWLLARGDTARASRFLTWTHAILWGEMAIQRMGMVVAEPHAFLLRARIADAAGQSSRAARYYREFLRRYDMPVAAHGAWVEEAIGALRRLGG